MRDAARSPLRHQLNFSAQKKKQWAGDGIACEGLRRMCKHSRPIHMIRALKRLIQIYWHLQTSNTRKIN